MRRRRKKGRAAERADTRSLSISMMLGCVNTSRPSITSCQTESLLAYSLVEPDIMRVQAVGAEGIGIDPHDVALRDDRQPYVGQVHVRDHIQQPGLDLEVQLAAPGTIWLGARLIEHVIQLSGIGVDVVPCLG